MASSEVDGPRSYFQENLHHKVRNNNFSPRKNTLRDVCKLGLMFGLLAFCYGRLWPWVHHLIHLFSPWKGYLKCSIKVIGWKNQMDALTKYILLWGDVGTQIRWSDLAFQASLEILTNFSPLQKKLTIWWEYFIFSQCKFT